MRWYGVIKCALVLIFNFEGHLFGLLAGLPVDVIETEALIDYDTLRQPGVLGSAILDGHTTLIIDISGLVQATHPEWLAARESPKEISPLLSLRPRPLTTAY